MGPIDYTLQVLDPIQAALQQRGLRFAEEQQVRAADQQDISLGQGQQRIDLARQQMMMQQAEAERRRQEQAAAQARAEAGQKAFVDFMFAPNKTAEQARAVIEANPEMGQAVMEYWQGQNEAQQASELAFAKQFAFALNKSPEAAKSMLESRADAAEQAGDQAKAATYRSQAEMLKMGGDGAEAVKAQTLAIMAGVMEPKDLQTFMEAAGYAGEEGDEPAAVQALRIRAQEAGLVPGSPEYQEFMAQGGAKGPQTVVNVGGEGAPGLGKLSTDYGYVLDPATGQPVIDPATGLPKAAPIPGSPAAVAAQETAARSEKRETQTANTASVVLQDIDNAISQVGALTAGAGGAILSRIPGSGARDLEGRLNTIKANIGFDRLQQMREASPTGGALGGIAVPELIMLQSVLGSLDQTQSPEQLAENLKRLKEIYEPIAAKAAAYPNAAEFGFAPASPSNDNDAFIADLRAKMRRGEKPTTEEQARYEAIRRGRQ